MQKSLNSSFTSLKSKQSIQTDVENYQHPYQDLSNSLNFELLLINNLNLMKYDKQEFYEKKYEIYQGAFKKSKTPSSFFLFILHFLIQKLTSDDDQHKSKSEINTLLMYFPPKNQSDINHFKQQAVQIMIEFEKERKIPKDFFIGKSVFEFSYIQSSIQFLYFLSEFSLKFQFQQVKNNFIHLQRKFLKIQKISQNFPKEGFKILNLNRDLKIQRQTDHQNQNISELYNQFSTNKIIKSSQQELQQACENLYTHINLEKEKQQKIIQKQLKYQQYIQQKADQLTQTFHKARAKNLALKGEFQKCQQQIPQDYFSENKGLDRRQQIDKSNAVFQELQQLDTFLENNNVIDKMKSYKQDTDSESQLNSICREDLIPKYNNNQKKQEDQQGFVSLNKLFDQFNVRLKEGEKHLLHQEYKYNVEIENGLVSTVRDLRLKMQKKTEQQQLILDQCEQLFQN